MEEIIKKAIKEDEYKVISTGWETSDKEWYAVTVLDPLFWQSLGKVLGWGKMPSGDIWQGQDRWFYSAMKFHEINLTEGWDAAVEWLSELAGKGRK